ncbi:AAA family ATPase [Dendrosporobacter sp. 1207_IL3150]|uniref:AAA family ATPase n=1 Tax=Dendrosporobacter sp. 1207_IL3150 TaxID=3084054 RepID=UPI002FDA4B6E
MDKNTTPEKSSNKKWQGGITSVRLCGFKSFGRERKVEFRPLTILAGPNSCGKSSVMQPLLLMKQTLECGYDPGAFLLNGPHVRCTSADQIINNSAETSCKDQINISIGFNEKNEYRIVYKKNPKAGLEVLETSLVIDSKEPLRIILNQTQDQLQKIVPEGLLSLVSRVMADKNEPYKRNKQKQKNANKNIPAPMPNLIAKRERCFLKIVANSKYDNATFNLGPDNPVESHIRQILHLPGLRGNPERSYPTTGLTADNEELYLPGTFEKYVASILNYWQKNDQLKLKRLEENLRLLGLANKLHTKVINDTQVEIFVDRNYSSEDSKKCEYVSIADVGLGVSQTLPVAVALIFAKPNQIVYIEQPEIHLHPKAQLVMAKLLVESASRGVKVIVETHSSLLIRGIQIAVAKKEIPHGLVKLHWFNKLQNGITEVSSADLDRNGAFGEWPEDFDDIALMAEMEYLNTVEEGMQSNDDYQKDGN